MTSKTTNLKWGLTLLDRISYDESIPEGVELKQDFGLRRASITYDPTRVDHLAYLDKLVRSGVVI